eukprot:3244410-Pyramimonas_sp.AAC.1
MQRGTAHTLRQRYTQRGIGDSSLRHANHSEGLELAPSIAAWRDRYQPFTMLMVEPLQRPPGSLNVGSNTSPA